MQLDEAKQVLIDNGYLVESVNGNELLNNYIDYLAGRGMDVELQGTMLFIDGEEVMNLGGYNTAYQIYMIGKELDDRGFFN